MKSLLQDRDVCELANSEKRLKARDWINGHGGVQDYYLGNYEEDLSRSNRKDSAFDVVKVIRNGIVIWENGKSLTTQPINKMMTFELNSEVYPLATHENMKILVDRVSELEAKVMELQAKLNEILK